MEIKEKDMQACAPEQDSEPMTPLSEDELVAVAGGENPFGDVPRVNVKEIDDRLRNAVGNPKP